MAAGAEIAPANASVSEGVDAAVSRNGGLGRTLGFLRPSREHTARSATLLLGFFALLSRVIGLLRDKYIAHTFGAGPATDAYNVSFQLPDLISSLLIGGAASISFVTILTRYRERGETEAGDRALSVILTTVALVLGAALGLSEFAVPVYSRHFCPPDPAVIALCDSMTRILLPGQIFFFAGGVLAAVALVRKQFTYQALAPLVYTGCIIAGGLLLGRRLGIQSLAWGAFAGALLGPVGVNGYAAIHAGARIRPAWDLQNPGLREWVRMSLPLMFGFTVVFMDQYLLTFFAKGHAGDISRVLYAKRLFSAAVAVIGQAAGAASMPFFASLFQRGEHLAFATAVNRSISRILAVALLLGAALFALAPSLTDLLLRGGAFGAEAAHETATFLAIFAVSLPFWAAQSLYARAFFAAGDTRTPMLGGTAVMILSIPFYWYLHARFGLAGLAWASNLAIVAQTAALALLAARRGLVPLLSPHPQTKDTAATPLVDEPVLSASTPLARPGVAPALQPDYAEIGRASLTSLLAAVGALLATRLLGQTGATGHLHAFVALLLGGAVWLAVSIVGLTATGSSLPQLFIRRRTRSAASN